MRLALVSQEYPPETAKGGLGTQTYLKAHGLAARGHEVHVISHTGKKAAEEWEYMDGDVHVIRISGFYHRMFIGEPAVEWLTYSAEVAAALVRLRAEHALDVIEFPEWGGEGYIHLLNRTPENYLPVVLQLHGPLVMFAHKLSWPAMNSEFYRIGMEMERTCFRLADAVFSSSRCSARWCLDHYHPRTDEIPVVHTGVDTELFAPRRVPKSSRPTIVFFSRVLWNKGIGTLFEACCQLASEFTGLELHVIGRGEEKVIKELEARSQAYPGLLRLSECVPRHKLATELSQAHVFAAPSIYEGGPGFVYLEAMACGLPVIGCSGSGLDEIIEPGVNGLLIPPNDTDALVRALRSLLTDVGRRDEMGKNARLYVLEHGRREVCLAEMETFYRGVVERSAASRR